MADKVQTIKYQGRDYAMVAQRLKQFREECPNGLIETEPVIRDDGKVIFKARILRDKNNADSGEATGHALSEEVGKGAKQFEKLETIAVGRALALLGYLASGEIASGDEMSEFIAFKEKKIDDFVELLESAKTIDELKRIFTNGGALIAEKRVIVAKDKRKAELMEVKK